MELITLKALQNIIHYSLHFFAPLCIALFFFKKDWKNVYLIFLSTMLVDLDHLFANPIFDANRCSIGFHYLHSFYFIVVYFLVLFFSKNKKIKLIAAGLIFHMATDFQDCLWLNNLK
jgi:hypothetical protein